MKLPIRTLANGEAGEIELSDDVFGLEPRVDLMHRAVRYQLAKRRRGTHHTKQIGDVIGTGKKPYKQKGTGSARQGSRRSPQFRGGGVIFGPLSRDHGHKLPKKVRKAALRAALSSKAREGNLIVIDQLAAESPKTKVMASALKDLNIVNALFIDTNFDDNFVLATRNLPHIEVLMEAGANVYDILRRDTLVLSRQAVASLEERLK